MPGVKVQDVLCLWFNTIVLIVLFSTLDNSKVTAMLSFLNSSDTMFMSVPDLRRVEAIILYEQ